MSDTLNNIIELVSQNEIRISAHGYRELAADDIFVTGRFRDGNHY